METDPLAISVSSQRSVHPRASRSGGIVAFTATAVGETSTSLARLKRLKLLADLHLFGMEFALPKRTPL